MNENPFKSLLNLHLLYGEKNDQGAGPTCKNKRTHAMFVRTIPSFIYERIWKKNKNTETNGP